MKIKLKLPEQHCLNLWAGRMVMVKCNQLLENHILELHTWEDGYKKMQDMQFCYSSYAHKQLAGIHVQININYKLQ